MCSVRFDALHAIEPLLVEVQDDGLISLPTVLAGDIFDTVIFPEAIGVTEGRDARLLGKTSTAKDEDCFHDLI